eukprot:3782453-Alexandrium_andersonii.AAC.1
MLGRCGRMRCYVGFWEDSGVARLPAALLAETGHGGRRCELGLGSCRLLRLAQPQAVSNSRALALLRSQSCVGGPCRSRLRC